MNQKYIPAPYVRIKHPDWSREATIYQINTRQFTPEGTLRAASAQLSRLKTLGIGILWLMPIHEIGVQNRKGTLGSPYAVKDYFSVSRELGSLDDLKQFVAEAHALDMRVILDWVPNHTAWDNPLVQQHPDWYKRNWKGQCRPTPWWDWSDVIDLDYSQPGLREYMSGALRYWVQEADIDGYRCDVAGYVPLDFWETVRAELDQIKPVFMLAEWESRDLHAQAFDMTYSWSWTTHTRKIAERSGNVEELYQYYATNEGSYPREAIRMLSVSNHDYNAWDGTEYDIYGDSTEAMIALSFVSEGMPLIYNGMEAGNTKQLAFFERDPIIWQDHPMNELLARLIRLKKENPALHNAPWGAPMTQIINSDLKNIFSFIRQSGNNRLVAAFNFSPDHRTFQLEEVITEGHYTDFQTAATVSLTNNTTMELRPWAYRILTMSA
ncbi:MAG: hypothetical protein KDI36_04710 [Pseudomonadales bacterium]|nr:hypothetical protein [Pseudomonadales bacterium]